MIDKYDSQSLSLAVVQLSWPTWLTKFINFCYATDASRVNMIAVICAISDSNCQLQPTTAK